MKHLTPEALERADDDAIIHLEHCQRCRTELDPDLDLEGVRRQILGQLADGSIVSRGSATRSWRWSSNRWVAAGLAAAVVTVIILPVAWFGFLTGPDTANSGTAVTGDLSVEPLQPVVELPERPPVPRPEDIAPPAVPAQTPDRLPFEMAFTLGDNATGRLIWASPTYFEAMRGNLTEDGAVFDYGMYRAADGSGYSDPDNSTITSDPEAFEIGNVPPDPEVPWNLLIQPQSDEDLWSELVEDGTAQIEVTPSHPLAARAWAVGDVRLEVTEDGIPVIIEGPGFLSLKVVSLDRRSLRTGELGNNTDLPFDYAVFLAATTSDEQRPVLEDGVVVFADYRLAAEAAAQCAGVKAIFDDDSGMYTFAEGTTVVDCVERYVDDIAAVWRLDSQWLGEGEWTAIWYEVHGFPEAVAMLEAEPGPELALASGNGWAISISERGPGFCTRTSAANSFGEGCFVPSQMTIPGVLGLDMSMLYEEDQPKSGTVLGIVTEQADEIVIRFSTGIERQLTPGHIAQFGYRGFGLLYDATAIGLPVEVELFDGDLSIAIYAITAFDDVARRTR